MVTIQNSINQTVGASNTGATNTLTVTNSSNTASSNALVNVTVGGTSAGDAFTTYTVAGTTNWSQGVDNSAADAFVLAASTALGTTNVMSASTGGQINYPLQSSFLAYPSANIDNVTGDGTQYRLICNSTLINVGSSYNTSTGEFVAPVAGTYLFCGAVGLAGLLVAHTSCIISVNTLLGAFRICRNNPFTSATSGLNSYPFSFISTMAASGVMTVDITVSGGTKVVDIFGDTANWQTYICGQLIS